MVKERLNMDEHLKIQNEYGTIICKFTILHHNWECDGFGYVVEKDGKRNIILTNHNKPYIATIEELRIKISDYKSAIQETERAIFLLK